MTLNPPVRVLSANVVRATAPDICRFRIENVDRERGTMALAWNVLETGDGAAIDLIYTGNRAPGSTAPRRTADIAALRLREKGPHRSDGRSGDRIRHLHAPEFSLWGRIASIVIFIAMIVILSHTLVYGVPGAIDVGP